MLLAAAVRPHTMARLRSPQWIATIGADLFFTGLHLPARIELQLRRAARPAGADGWR
jgi:hypothetical protein